MSQVSRGATTLPEPTRPAVIDEISSGRLSYPEQELSMRVSVAMCTYNGSRYLRDQLESIAAQTRMPDEVVICDDNSRDDTRQVVQRWATQVPFPVRLYVNHLNLGVIKNFERATSLCEGDIIALSDQDDVWCPAKLARQEALLLARPDVGLVFTDAGVVDEQLHPLGYSMWDSCRFSRAEQALVKEGKAVDVLLRRNVVTGGTMAFRSEYRPLVLPIPQNSVHLHDYWIAFLIASVGGVDFLTDRLVQYRQQPGQQVGAHQPITPRFLLAKVRGNSRKRMIERHQLTVEWFGDVRWRLDAESDRHHPHRDTFREIDAKIDLVHERIRIANSSLRRYPWILRDLVTRRYHHYSIGAWAAIQDLTV